MILLYPDVPEGEASVEFDIQRNDFAAPEAGGRQGGVQSGWPLWIARFELNRADEDGGDLWRAFFRRMRGRIRRFYAYDPLREYPKAYRSGFSGLSRAGGGGFDGSATSWSQSIDSDGDALITLNGLPSGFAIAEGDYIGFKWDADGAAAGSYERRTIAAAVLPATASGSGQMQVTAEPPLDPRVVPAGAIAHFDRPSCVMQLVPEESRVGPTGIGRQFTGGGIVALQDLKA